MNLVHFDGLKDQEKKTANVVTASTSVSVVDAEKDPRLLQGLDYTTWLPFAAKTYQISPNIDDYVLVVTPICPSDIPNRNGIGFPLAELTKFQPPPVSRMAYKAWAGCPVHYEHKNDVHEEAYGVILDASLHKITGYGQGKLWKVMGLLGIDKRKYPEMARRVMEGEVNTYSMGAYVDSFSCSYCNEEMYTEKDTYGRKRHHHCAHLNPDNDIDWSEVNDWNNVRHIAYRNAHGISPIETSIVESPAWTTALSDHILTRGE